MSDEPATPSARRTATRWFVVAMAALFLAGVLFIIGLRSSFALQIRELCTVIYNVPYDPPPPPHAGLTWPFSRKCNADHNLVPAYVNPGFIAFGTIGAVALVGFLVQTGRTVSAELRQSRRSQNGDVT